MIISHTKKKKKIIGNVSLIYVRVLYSQTSTSDIFWLQLKCVRCRIMSDVEASTKSHFVRLQLLYLVFIYEGLCFQQTDNLGLKFKGFTSLCQNSH